MTIKGKKVKKFIFYLIDHCCRVAPVLVGFFLVFLLVPRQVKASPPVEPSKNYSPTVDVPQRKRAFVARKNVSPLRLRGGESSPEEPLFGLARELTSTDPSVREAIWSGIVSFDKLDKQDDAKLSMKSQGALLVQYLSAQGDQEPFIRENKNILYCDPLGQAMGMDRYLLLKRFWNHRLQEPHLTTTTLESYRQWYSVAQQAMGRVKFLNYRN